MATGQRLLEGIELADATRRGQVHPYRPPGDPPTRRRPHPRARAAGATFTWLATRLATRLLRAA